VSSGDGKPFPSLIVGVIIVVPSGRLMVSFSCRRALVCGEGNGAMGGY
jgi:hypothetical protein